LFKKKDIYVACITFAFERCCSFNCQLLLLLFKKYLGHFCVVVVIIEVAVTLMLYTYGCIVVVYVCHCHLAHIYMMLPDIVVVDW